MTQLAVTSMKNCSLFLVWDNENSGHCRSGSVAGLVAIILEIS